MDKKEVNEMFKTADITTDDLVKYLEQKYGLEDYSKTSREDVQSVIDRILEWKNKC